MKRTLMKYLFVTSFILLVQIFISTAQEMKDTSFKWHSNNVLKINAIGVFSKFIEIGYERVITDKFSALVAYGSGKEKNISGEDAKQNYLDKYGGLSFNYILGNTEQIIKIKNHLNVEFRFYTSHKHTLIPAGFHIGPSINYLNYNEKFLFYDDTGMQRDRRENNYKVISINASLGPQILIHRIVAIDLFIAPGYGILSASEGELSNTNKNNYTGEGFTIAFGIFCGIAIGK